MKEILNNNNLLGLLEGKLSMYKVDNVSAVWCEEKDLDGVEIPDGATVRLRTKGGNCYLGKKSFLVIFVFIFVLWNVVQKWSKKWYDLGAANTWNLESSDRKIELRYTFKRLYFNEFSCAAKTILPINFLLPRIDIV